MNSFSIVTNIKNGKMIRNRNRILDAIECFEGKEVEITIKKKRKQRSNNQNAYYWSVIIPLAQDAVKQEWGEIWNVEMTHEFLKGQFLYTERVNEETGEVARIPKSTTENTTVEQEVYHQQIREFLLEWFNVVVPMPNEEITLNL